MVYFCQRLRELEKRSHASIVPENLESADEINDCSRVVYFIAAHDIWHFVLPEFQMFNWNSYIWPLIITQKETMWVIQVQLANLVGGGYVTPWNIVLAAAVIAALPTFLLFFVMQKYLVEGIKMTGIK